MKARIVLSVLTLSIVGTLSVTTGARDTGKIPRIYLEKKIIAEKKRGRMNYFEVHRVSKGETLWKIFMENLEGRPEEFNMFLSAFKEGNPHIKDPGLLRISSEIRLPVTVGSLGKRNIVKSLIEEGKIYEHKVKKGDTLWDLARVESETVSKRLKFLEEIIKLNPFLANPDLIFPGQRLYVPRHSFFEVKEKLEEKEEVPLFVKREREEGDKGILERREGKSEEPSPGKIVYMDREETGPPKADIPPVPKDEKKIVEAPRGGGPVDARRETEIIDLSKPLLDKGEEEVKGRVEREYAYPEKSLGERAEKETERATVTVLPGDEARRGEEYEERPLRFLGLAGDLLSALGEKVVLKGEIYLPLGGGGELVLNMKDYPLVRFDGGKSVILDLNGSLPPDVKKAVTQMWVGYSVMSLGRGDNTGEFIRALLSEGGYFSVKEGDSAKLTIGDRVSISLDTDLIILKQKDSILKGEVFALKELDTPDIVERHSSVYAYCLRSGITIIPYFIDRTINEGFIISYRETPGQNVGKRERLTGGLIEDVKRVLDLTGIKNSSSQKISIKGSGGAYSLKIKPDLVFWVRGIPHILDPDRFAEPIRDLLEKESYQIFRVKKGTPLNTTLENLLKTINVKYSALNDDRLGGGDGKGYVLKGTGIFIDKESAGGDLSLLLVNGDVDTGMGSLLLDQFGIRVVTY